MQIPSIHRFISANPTLANTTFIDSKLGFKHLKKLGYLGLILIGAVAGKALSNFQRNSNIEQNFNPNGFRINVPSKLLGTQDELCMAAKNLYLNIPQDGWQKVLGISNEITIANTFSVAQFLDKDYCNDRILSECLKDCKQDLENIQMLITNGNCSQALPIAETMKTTICADTAFTAIAMSCKKPCLPVVPGRIDIQNCNSKEDISTIAASKIKDEERRFRSEFGVHFSYINDFPIILKTVTDYSIGQIESLQMKLNICKQAESILEKKTQIQEDLLNLYEQKQNLAEEQLQAWEKIFQESIRGYEQTEELIEKMIGYVKGQITFYEKMETENKQALSMLNKPKSDA